MVFIHLHSFSANTDWVRAQLSWGQFNHFQNSEYGSTSSHHPGHHQHASQNINSSGTAAVTTMSADWYDQSWDYAQHAQLNYHRSVGGIFN